MIKVFIQVATGSPDKRFYDEQTLEYKETRCVSQPYPYPYGFILGTRGADGDCVDCYLITKAPLQSGTMVECEPVGLLEQDENGEMDHKILAVLPGEDTDVGVQVLDELREFIHALFAPFPDVRVRVGPILPRAAALRQLEESKDE